MNHLPHRVAGFRRLAREWERLAAALPRRAPDIQSPPAPAAAASRPALPRFLLPALTLAAALLAGLAAPAHAQMVLVTDESDSPLKCLVPPDAPARFPRGARIDLIDSGLVRVAMRFTAPDRQPDVEVLAMAGHPSMVTEAVDHARRHRLPCMDPARGPVQAVQTLTFSRHGDDQQVRWGTAAHEPDPESAALMRCLRTPDRGLHNYPGVFMKDVNNFIARMVFVAPDQPPEITLDYSGGSPRQAQEVKEYLSQYRLPCLPPGARPITTRQQISFQASGRRAALKASMALVDFLATIKDIRQQALDFNFDTMGCPFEVGWALGRPAVPNSVGQVGTPDRNRLEFLAWLSQLEMDLTPHGFDALLGSRTRLHVPCGALRQEPGAKSTPTITPTNTITTTPATITQGEGT